MLNIIILSVDRLSVVMLNVNMLSVIMLSVVMLRVVAPVEHHSEAFIVSSPQVKCRVSPNNFIQ
jgi:hypothetical protein